LRWTEPIFRSFRLDPQGLKSGDLRTYLLRAATGTFVLRIGSTVLLFITSIFLARMLGTAGFGAYANGRAWLRLACVLAGFGFPGLLIRQTAVYRAGGQWGLFRGMIRFSGMVSLANAVVLMACGLLLGWVLYGPEDIIMLHTFWIALLALPLVVMMQLEEAAISGFKRVILGQLADTMCRPMLFLAIVGIMYLVFTSELNAPLVMASQVVTAFLALILGTYWFHKVVSGPVDKAVPIEYRPREWLSTAMPLLFVSGMYVVTSRSSLVILGAMEGAEAAGIYKAALRGAELLIFPMFAISKPFQPLVASLYAEGAKERLQHIVTNWTRLAFFVSIPLAIGFWGWGDLFLSIFGSEFIKGHTTLSILSIGRIIGIGTGMAALLLNMSGNEKESAIGMGLGAILNIVLCFLFIPYWGTVGAAAAESVSSLFWNAFLVVKVLQRMDIHPTVLGKIRCG